METKEQRQRGEFVDFKVVSREESENFGRNQENRQINHGQLQKIKRQCMTSFELMPPITVNILTDNIIDGQHRLKAFQELVDCGMLPSEAKIKVMFVRVQPNEEPQAIIDANTNSKNWSIDDYIASYVKKGLESYVILDDWCRRHSLASDENRPKFRYGAAIITGKRCSTILKCAEFTASEEEMKRAEDVHAEMLEIIDLFQIRGKGAWIEALAVSWIACREQFEFRTWLKELKAKRKTYSKLPKDNSADWNNIFGQATLAINKKGISVH